jgi:hypothetical protein
MRYRGDRKPVPEIAAELRVDGIVEGTVQRDGDRVRVTAHLVHGPTGTTLWGEEYDGELRDVLTLQARIAQAIARGVSVEAGAEEVRRLSASRPVDPQVYQDVGEARIRRGVGRVQPDRLLELVARTGQAR